MKIRQLFVFLMVLLIISPLVHASSYVLSTRQRSSGEYEAAITYSNQDYCFVGVNPPSSVTINGYDILIVSPGPANITCIGKVPPELFFEETVSLGKLKKGKYNVTWDQDRSFSLSTTLRVGDTTPIPSSSTWALFSLILTILALAYLKLNFKPR